MNTKEKEEKAGCTDFASACKGFQGMFQEMTQCCADKGGFTDCSAMMDGMMKRMMETCCRPKTDSTKKDCTKCYPN
jgi:hypothetical protein